jgi:hypothetical protein
VKTDFQLKLTNSFQILDNLDQEYSGVNKIEKVCKNIKETVQNCAKEVCGKKDKKNKKPWFDEECKVKVSQRKKQKRPGSIRNKKKIERNIKESQERQ